MTRTRASLALAAFLSLFAVACSGGGEDAPLTPEEAAALASAGLLTMEQLPGSGWEEVPATDDPEEDDSLTAGADEIPACEPLAAFFEEGDAEGEEDGYLAEAEVEFNSETDFIVRNVASAVAVTESEEEAEAQIEVIGEFFASDAARDCFEELFRAGFEEGGEVEGVELTSLEVGEPLVTPEGGNGFAIDAEILAVVITLDMHMEMVFWHEGPAMGNLMWMEMNSETLRDEADALVASAEEQLATAVEEN